MFHRSFVLVAACLASCSSAFMNIPHRRSGQLSVVQRPTTTSTRTSSSSATLLYLSPPELIDLGVKVDTFLPQPFWLAMVAAPRSEATRKVMGPLLPILGLSLIHLVVVLLAASAPGGIEPILIFADVFDPSKNQLDGMERLFAVRDFVAEEWPHVLIWDLFAGRAIWLDAVARKVPSSVAAPSLLLTNFIGPPGLLLYATLCTLTGRGLPTLGYDEADDSWQQQGDE